MMTLLPLSVQLPFCLSFLVAPYRRLRRLCRLAGFAASMASAFPGDFETKSEPIDPPQPIKWDLDARAKTAIFWRTGVSVTFGRSRRLAHEAKKLTASGMNSRIREGLQLAYDHMAGNAWLPDPPHEAWAQRATAAAERDTKYPFLLSPKDLNFPEFRIL